jgi:hypothetical protein
VRGKVVRGALAPAALLELSVDGFATAELRALRERARAEAHRMRFDRDGDASAASRARQTTSSLTSENDLLRDAALEASAVGSLSRALVVSRGGSPQCCWASLSRSSPPVGVAA